MVLRILNAASSLLMFKYLRRSAADSRTIFAKLHDRCAGISSFGYGRHLWRPFFLRHGIRMGISFYAQVCRLARSCAKKSLIKPVIPAAQGGTAPFNGNQPLKMKKRKKPHLLLSGL
jgi:hypothetical protein